jgi:hypothetical protein
LYVKITEPGRRLMGDNYAEGFAYPGAKASIHVSAELLEDRKFISELVSVTEKALPESESEKKK